MTAAPVRCTAPHPTKPGWVCNQRLADAIPGSVSVRSGGATGPGCVRIKCPRCGKVYVVCPT